ARVPRCCSRVTALCTDRSSCVHAQAVQNRTFSTVFLREIAMRKGAATRERILEIAEAAVLSKGFGATSIEELIAEAGITKSGFFYHFKDKNELARGLLQRYEEQNDRLLADVMGRARQLSDDPLQILLIGLTLFAERMAALPEGHPGCMVATMSYQ